MTGKIVSLSRARKNRARDEKRRKADENAARHGRTRSERLVEESRAAKADRDLDNHKRDD